jgi:chromosome segregation ATPase
VEDIQRDLEKRIKNKTKSKFVKTGSETSIENTVIKEIGDDPVNVYVQVTSLDSGARVTAFIEDQNKFIGEDNDKYNLMSSFIRDFGAKAYHEKVEGHIKSENKILSDLEGDLNKLRKQNEKMHSDISENESTITNSEVDIKSNAKQQELKDDEIIKQKSVVNSTTDKDAKKLENKKLHDLEKEKDKFRNEVSSLHKKIVKSRSGIETLEHEIKLNLQEQDLLEDKITKQRGFVKGLEGKLEKIK